MRHPVIMKAKYFTRKSKEELKMWSSSICPSDQTGVRLLTIIHAFLKERRQEKRYGGKKEGGNEREKL
jgi:hypothetical protein